MRMWIQDMLAHFFHSIGLVRLDIQLSHYESAIWLQKSRAREHWHAFARLTWMVHV